MIYIVLGMHKSGTTLLAQILHESGINMVDGVDHSSDYDSGNKYERVSTYDVNIDLLSRHFMLSKNEVRSRSSVEFAPTTQILAGEVQREQMQQAIQECSQRHSDWGFKDPRTCLTYHTWSEELPPHKVLAIFRSYTEVFSHYRRRWNRRYNFGLLRKVMRAWESYNSHLINHIENSMNPYLILNYEALLTEPEEYERLVKFVNHPLKDVRDNRLYRMRSTSPYDMPFFGRVVAATMSGSPSHRLRQLYEMRAAQFQKHTKSMAI